MVYRIVFMVAIAASLISVTFPTHVATAQLKGDGLFVSPLRYEIDIAAGESQAGYVTVANRTDKPMTVNMSIKKFSVSDYKYDYNFDQTDLDWIKISIKSFRLEPGERKDVQYEVTVPANYAAGGYYFSLLTSTTMEKGGTEGTVQAATLLYVTVDGDKARKAGEIKNEQISSWLTDVKIPYKFDFTNTGNVHMNGYFFARLDGVFGKHAEVGSYHISLPETTRMIEGVMSAPMLPGIYHLTYGYKDKPAEDKGVMKSKYIVFIPPWSVAALLLAGLTSKWLWQRRSRSTEA